MRDLTAWLKKYSAETLLSVCILFVVILSVIAGSVTGYILGVLLIAALVYFILQLKKAAQLRLNRLQELDRGNREQLLNSNSEFDPDSVVTDITDNLRFATEFVREIGKGNFNARLQGITDDNFALNKENLAGELVSMKVKMKASAEEEKKRVWATEGLANFGELLRTSNHDLSKLSEEVVIFVVKYLKANQGGIFILNDENEHDKFLELKAAYAFERKKYLTKRVALGEGLVGQTYLERETIHLRQIPTSYISITSGLGGANPHTLILVPLKVEENVVGVLEIASFKDFEKHEIEFCEKIGESIASTIAAVKVNERTRILLDQSQQQAEEMRAQEEEMRQNMEELSATQEDMQRVMKEMETKEAYTSSILDVSKDLIFTVDKGYRLVNWNKSFAISLERFGMKMEKGTDTLVWYPDEAAKRKQIETYKRVFNGETFEDITPSEINGATYYFLTTNTPLRNKNNEIIEAAVFSKDVTEATLAQQKVEKMLSESQQQSEELKAQEEELRQNMEELQATQESVERGARESQEKEAYLKYIIDSSNDAIMTIDRNYQVSVVNKYIYETFKKQGVELRPGLDVFSFAKGDRSVIKDRYDRVFGGETIIYTESYFGKHYQITNSPVRNQEGAIVGACVFTRDVTNDILLKTKTEELLNVESKKTQEIQENRKILADLARNQHVQNGNLQEALEAITTTLANRFQISRAAVWSYRSEDRSIELAKLYEKEKATFSSGMVLYQKDIPRYFQSVETEEVIVAANAFNHPAIAEFKTGYLDVLNIKSMLDVPFFISGKVGGVICCEHQGVQKNWSLEEEDFAKSVADIITIAYKAARMKDLVAETRQHYENQIRDLSNGASGSWPVGLETVEKDLRIQLEAAQIARQATKNK